MSDTYFEAWNLQKVYPTRSGHSVVVKDFTLQMRRGEFVCIIGHSGCGKSTVLSMVAGLNELSAGGLILDAKEVVGAGPDRGVVFQAPCLLPWMTARENVLLGVNQVYPHATRAEREEIVAYYLHRVGLGSAASKKPSELSGGMKQRVGLARAFALAPKMLLLDEPFGMLDKLTKFELQQVLLELWERERLTALMVTHDVDESIFLADRVVMMTNGSEAEIGDILEIPFPRPRDRKQLLHDPRYYLLREYLLRYLNELSGLKGDMRPLLHPEQFRPPELLAFLADTHTGSNSAMHNDMVEITGT